MKINSFIRCLLVIIFVQGFLSGNTRSPFSQQKHEGNPPQKTAFSSDIQVQLAHMAELCAFELNFNNDDQTFDSLSMKAISIAEASFDPELILKTYLSYLSLVKTKSDVLDIKKIIGKTDELAQKLENKDEKFEIWLVISKSAINLGLPNIAHKYALKAFSEASMNQNSGEVIKAYLSIGKSLEIQHQLIEAYQNYLNALYQTELLQDRAVYGYYRNICYRHFFDFFSLIKDFNKAAEFKQQEIQLYFKEEKIDSLQLFWAKYDLCGISVQAKIYGNLSERLTEILVFANKKGNKKLRDYTLSLYRSFLIQTNDFKGFYDLYVIRYPKELKRMEAEDPILMYRIQAKIAEFEEDVEKATRNYQKAEALFTKDHSPIFRSNFYRRYGQFLMRNGDLAEARKMFLQSFDFASQNEYLDYMLESSKYIDSISFITGNFEEAYTYAKIHSRLKQKQKEINREKEFLIMDLANESKHMDLIKQKEKEKKKKKFNLQYLIITIGISMLFLFFILLSSLKVPEWVIRGIGFLSVLMLFEFIILLLDHEIHQLTHGAPLWIFTIKVLILFVLFPLHHLVEKGIIKYMISNKLIWKSGHFNPKKIIHKIWPWMGEQDQ